MSSRHERTDRVFEVMSHRDRRRLLVALRKHTDTEDPQYDVGALSEAIVQDGDAEQAQVQMVHRHLPKLEDFGYVRWDREAGTVEKGPEWTALEPFLGLLDDHGPELADDLP